MSAHGVCSGAQAWWYRQWVWRWIAQHRLGTLDGAAQPTIGFHMRGGDVFEVDNEQVGLPLPACSVALLRSHAKYHMKYLGCVAGACAIMLAISQGRL